MSAPSLKSQASCRAFAFGDHEQRHDTLSSLDRTRLAQLEDLLARANVMYANGYRASGDALMARVSRLEGRA